MSRHNLDTDKGDYEEYVGQEDKFWFFRFTKDDPEGKIEMDGIED